MNLRAGTHSFVVEQLKYYRMWSVHFAHYIQNVYFHFIAYLDLHFATALTGDWAVGVHNWILFVDLEWRYETGLHLFVLCIY